MAKNIVSKINTFLKENIPHDYSTHNNYVKVTMLKNCNLFEIVYYTAWYNEYNQKDQIPVVTILSNPAFSKKLFNNKIIFKRSWCKWNSVLGFRNSYK